MLDPITIRYEFKPRRRSLATAAVADLFGLAEREPAHTLCENLQLDIRRGDVALFVGPSGSGKSSLLRAVAAQLGAVDAFALPLPEAPLIDAFAGSVEEKLARLAACGLSEARLLLRTPSELSEGQRYRFRLAHALAQGASWVACDEFTATLDRTLAKVVAFNLRKLVSRSSVGLLVATTHEDIVEDLAPDVLVRCAADGPIRCERRVRKRRCVSFVDELQVTDGTASDWPHFARWHYRGHRLAFVKRLFLLWHSDEPVGVCVFATPAASLARRSRFFGLTDPRASVALAALNQHLWLLQRVVLHPTYRGAGIASAFVHRACELCPVDWIEALTAMGRANSFFERAGFVRVGTVERNGRVGQFGPKFGVARETVGKSRFAEPIYYVFDNRSRPLA